jgi:predicted phage baseplate assembly protein
VPLEAPELDTRKFEDLVREAELRIPRYAPEWTDYNESDPGITLVQLFAWLTEMMLYQMNRVPERNYIKFLQMLGMELQPAQPAHAHLTFTAKPDGAATAPRRTRIQAQTPDGPPAVFETLEGLDFVRAELADVQVFDGSAFTSMTEANKTPGTTFPPLGWLPQTGSALYLGFKPPDPPSTARLFPQEMRFRVFLPAESQAGKPVSCRDNAQTPAPPVTLVWEYRPAADPTRWRRLNVFKDDSVAFTREGYVNVEGPKDPAQTEEGKPLPKNEKRFWLRVRLAAKTYPAGEAPVIDFIRPNTVEAENLSTTRDEFLGTSEGLPGQLFTLAQRPASPDSFELVVGPAGGESKPWERVEDFLASGPDDEHFVLKAAAGEVSFGDGRRGLIPPAGFEISARLYRHGGGGAGNVPAGSITTPLGALEGVKVTNERPAAGGRDEQDVETLKERAPRLLRSRDRAITPEDYAALAAQAGEVRKATALALSHPDHPGVEVPGAVTVVVVPEADIEDPAPKPSADLIARVCRYLDERRLLTTELYVKGPEYQEVRVEARVEASPYAAFDAVARDVARALNEYLDPLGRKEEDEEAETPGAGAAGSPAAGSPTGWDFGRDLFPTNLFNVILDVEDVMAVPHLAVFIDGRPHELDRRVTVERDGLLYGASDHEITVVPATDL